MFKLLHMKSKKAYYKTMFYIRECVVQWISIRLWMQIRQRNDGTFLRKVMIVMKNSRKFSYKHLENNSNYYRWIIMRRLLSISTLSHKLTIRWKVFVNLFMIKPSWEMWCILLSKFYYIVVYIKELNDLSLMKFKEL